MQQSTALALLKAGKNVFLTGSAGTGKTHVLQSYIHYLHRRRVSVAVTASTGIAATHIKGSTVHAWSGIGLNRTLSSEQLDQLYQRRSLREQIEKTKVLIIDEISMLHKTQLDLVDQVLRHFKRNHHAFGGIQIIVSGDFFQLPPVGYAGETNKEKFAFMAKAWLAAKFTVCYLTEQFRQKAGDLQQILNEIRQNKVSEHSRTLLRKTQNNQFDPNIIPPTLYTHNHDVNRTNNAHLRALSGKMYQYKANVSGKKRLIERLKKSVLADETLYLKAGAVVIFVKNNPERGYVNGTLGMVMHFEEEGLPVIKTTDERLITAQNETWQIEDDYGKPLASFEQLPLRLAWAVTVHKSQGMTLECAKVDLSRTFEKGQGYVALSRVRDLTGLKLVDFNETALQVDGFALKADHRLRQLSEETETALDAKALEGLEHRATVFLRHCGGIIDPEAIERYNKQLKDRRQRKKATHLITKDLIDQGMSLPEIAHERGLTEGTITGHLVKLHESFPQLNLSAYSPPSDTLNAIVQATERIKNGPQAHLVRPDGSVPSKVLYEELKQQVSYNTLKLARLFMKPIP